MTIDLTKPCNRCSKREGYWTGQGADYHEVKCKGSCLWLKRWEKNILGEQS